MTSPTKRTMDACRQATCGKCPPWLKESRPLVEKVEVFTKYEKTRDLLGFIDVVCYCPPYEIGIRRRQVTTWRHAFKRSATTGHGMPGTG